jgi:biotin operon repressor
MKVKLHNGKTTETKDVSVSKAIVAGWTGRDRVALEKHIKELEELGVARPASTPIYYRVSASRITPEPLIETTGEASSGEVEFVLAQWGGQMWVGVGSDHTDRQVETYNVTVSKQMCEKPVAAEFWRYSDVAPHWDKLVMRSWIEENGERVLYQEGSVIAMLDPMTLVSGYEGKPALDEGALMFCGTFAAKGGIRPADNFDFEIHDPVLGRTISHGYRLAKLPVLG